MTFFNRGLPRDYKTALFEFDLIFSQFRCIRVQKSVAFTSVLTQSLN